MKAAFAKAEIVSAKSIDWQTDLTGKLVTPSEVTLVANGQMQGFYPTAIKIGDDVVKLTAQDYEKGNVAVAYLNHGGDELEGSGYPERVGDYKAVLKVGDSVVGNAQLEKYSGATRTFDLHIKAAAIEGVEAYDANGNGFTFNNVDQSGNVALTLDGKMIDVADLGESYDSEALFIFDGFYQAGDANRLARVDEVKWVGDYYVKIVGKQGTKYEGAEKYVPFSIAQLDLSKAVITADDVLERDLANAADSIKINNIPVTEFNDNNVTRISIAVTNGPKGAVLDGRGHYTFSVSATENTAQITGSGAVGLDAVYEKTTAITYQNKELDGFVLNNDLTDGGMAFNAEIIVVRDCEGQALTYGEDYDIAVKNGVTGAPATIADVNTPGSWKVTVKVDSEHYNWELGGSATMTVNTVKGQVNTAANVQLSYDGAVVSGSASATYDGTDLSSKLKSVVTDVYGKRLVEGTDYTVTWKDGDGNVVDSVVDAGTYYVIVSSDSYQMQTGKLTFTVNPIPVSEVRIANIMTLGEDSFVPYTGEAITPVLEYKAGNTWKTLPADTYLLTYQYSKDGTTYAVAENMQKVGYYKIFLHAAANVQNYAISDGVNDSKGFIHVLGTEYYVDDDKVSHLTDVVEVSDKKVYLDVPNTAWYAECVWQAADQGYMHGYDGTAFFGPMDTLTRAQAVQVLYNMAGGRSLLDNETGNWTVSFASVATDFSDTVGNAWYSQALGWAVKTGVVEGYVGSDEFGPNDEITREQWAVMLCNYARAMGDYEAAADDALAEMPDADEVSGWAVDEVSWAVENEVMGDAGYIAPKQPINRAEVAKMAVNYQPVAPKEITILP